MQQLRFTQPNSDLSRDLVMVDTIESGAATSLLVPITITHFPGGNAANGMQVLVRSKQGTPTWVAATELGSGLKHASMLWLASQPASQGLSVPKLLQDEGKPLKGQITLHSVDLRGGCTGDVGPRESDAAAVAVCTAAGNLYYGNKVLRNGTLPSTTDPIAMTALSELIP